jgi:type IV pilus assembly protein PilE
LARGKLKRYQQLGFSLVELMIVLAIVAILASIAYPTYEDHLRKARRSDGQSALLELANLMEHYYTENNSYSGAQTPTVVGGVLVSREGYYNLTIGNLTSGTYTLTATPIPGSSQASDTCGALSLTHTNVKGPNEGCW